MAKDAMCGKIFEYVDLSAETILKEINMSMNYLADFLNLSPAKKKVFISFDYDHDLDLKNLLVGQAMNDDSPFTIIDMSVKEELTGDWVEKVRGRMKRVEQVVVICGSHTHIAGGVSIEVKLAQEEGIPYFLLWGRDSKTCVKPKTAKSTDDIYKWTWPNLKALLNGSR